MKKGAWLCRGRALKYKRALLWATPAADAGPDYAEKEYLLKHLVMGMPRRAMKANVDVDVKQKRHGGGSEYTVTQSASRSRNKVNSMHVHTQEYARAYQDLSTKILA